MNPLSPLREPFQALAVGLLRLGAWIYLRFDPGTTRITITFSHYVEADEEEEETTQATPGVDPTYVEWLNEVFKNSPESDTRMG